jgi:hypothetical protein
VLKVTGATPSGGPIIVQSVQATSGANMALPNAVTVGNYLLAFISQASPLANFDGMPLKMQATDYFTTSVYGQVATSTTSPVDVVTGNGFMCEVSGVTNALFTLEALANVVGSTFLLNHNTVNENSTLIFMTNGDPNPEGAIGLKPANAKVLTSGFPIVGYQSYPIFAGEVNNMNVGNNQIVYLANGANPQAVSAELS